MYNHNAIRKHLVPDLSDYLLDFSFHDCEKQFSGCCPVQQLREQILQGINLISHPDRCVRLISSICRSGYTDPLPRSERIRITWSRHRQLYYVHNGRHRICGAAQLGIPIVLYEEESLFPD